MAKYPREQLTIRIPADLKQKISDEFHYGNHKGGMSMTDFVVNAIKESFDLFEKNNLTVQFTDKDKNVVETH